MNQIAKKKIIIITLAAAVVIAIAVGVFVFSRPKTAQAGWWPLARRANGPEGPLARRANGPEGTTIGQFYV